MLRTLYLQLVMVICCAQPVMARDGQPELAHDKINLALRRTADKLLRSAGDNHSRIPAIKQISESGWRVYLEHPFSYDTLPTLLQSSLDMYGIDQTYEVVIRQCESATIDLGYHQRDFLQDSLVPCGGRIAPEGCHYMDVTFLTSDQSKASWARVGALLCLIFLVAIGGWWYRRRSMPTIVPPNDREGEWLAFGQSRLHLAGQVLECGSVRHALTYREAKLLRLFASHPDQLLEREHILGQVWADEGVQVGRSIDMFVSRLRKKLKADPTVGIVAVHGLGYRLETGMNGEQGVMTA